MSQSHKVDYGLLLALILPIFAVMPLFVHAGLPNTADGPIHLMRQVELNEAWQQGNYYPRWGTDLALGHGMPIFSYAPPALYHLTQLFHLAGLPLDEAMKAVVILDFLLYSLGMFLFARRVFGSGPALLAAALYVYAPYRLREAYIQGNYGQFTGLAFYPLIFWAFHGLITDGRPRYMIAAGLSLAGLLFSHNISAMLFGPIFATYLLFLLMLTLFKLKRAAVPPPTTADRNPSGPRLIVSDLRLVVRTATGGLLGLGLAAIFWLPAFGERDEIKLEGIVQGFFDFRENFIPLSELFSPPLPLDLTAINPEFPLSLGLPQIIGAGLALIGLLVIAIRSILGRPKPPASGAIDGVASENRPLIDRSVLAHAIFFAGFLLLYGFLTLPQSQSIWEAVPLLELAEFPWRLLGPAVFCASLLAAGVFARVTRFSQRLLLCGILLTIALNAHYLYPSQFIPWGTPGPVDAFAYEVASGAIGTTSTGEFLPRSAQQHPQPETLWPDYEAGRSPRKIDPATLPAGASVEVISHQAESDRWQISTPTEFVATIRTLYWPGWQLYRNGQPAPFSITEETGLIRTSIPPGEHTLALRLESTPLRTAGGWLTFLSFIALLAITMVAFLKRTHQPVRPQPMRILNPNVGLAPRFFAVTVGILILGYLVSRPLAPFFTLQSDPNRPRPADRILQADFEDQIRLVGMDNLPQTIQQTEAGAELTVVLYWRALQNLETNYSIFLHLDAPDGRTLATIDEVNPENIPTRNWPPGLYLRNPLHLQIPPDIPPIRYDVTTGLYNRETNERLTLASGEGTAYKIGSIWVTGPQPHLTGAPLARFGPDITLIEAIYPTDEREMLTLYWQTGRAVEQNYSIFVHLLDGESRLLGQKDGVPYDGLYPPVSWQPGQIIIDRRALPSLDGAEGQLDAFAVGVYDPATGERLPITDSNGHSLVEDSLIIPVRP